MTNISNSGNVNFHQLYNNFSLPSENIKQNSTPVEDPHTSISHLEQEVLNLIRSISMDPLMNSPENLTILSQASEVIKNLQSLNTQLTTVNNSIQTTTALLKPKNKILENKKTQLDLNSKKLEKIQKSKAKNELEIQNINNRLIDAKNSSEINELNDIINEKQSKIQNQTKLENQLKNQITDDLNILNDLQQQINSLQNELNSHLEKRDELINQLSGLKTELAKVKELLIKIQLAANTPEQTEEKKEEPEIETEQSHAAPSKPGLSEDRKIQDKKLNSVEKQIGDDIKQLMNAIKNQTFLLEQEQQREQQKLAQEKAATAREIEKQQLSYDEGKERITKADNKKADLARDNKLEALHEQIQTNQQQLESLKGQLESTFYEHISLYIDHLVDQAKSEIKKNESEIPPTGMRL